MSTRAPKFNPLDYPLCLSTPLRLAPTAWAAHIPFALLLVDALRPRTIVELGTYSGVSYCAFCQAVKELQLDTRCYAIDTWQGDEHNGFYGVEILKDLKEYHDPLYADFSTLIHSTFDEALPRFADGTVDLLHIDGYHTYEAVRHDFESWLPKMSAQGVVLLHDINVREQGFGVWRLWAEIRQEFPHFEFTHEYGLGVIASGKSMPAGLRPLLEVKEDEAATIREFFSQLGARFRLRLDQAQELAERQLVIEGLSTAYQETATRLNAMLNSRAWAWVSRYAHIKTRYLIPAYRLFRPAAQGARPRPASMADYHKWIREYDTLTDADRRLMQARIAQLKLRPLISIIMPVYNVSERWLRRAIESVRQQLYPHWELCIADDHSTKRHIRRVLEEYAQADSRIKVGFRPERGHISAASNTALALATGDFVAFLDHDDELAPHALYLVAEEINAHPDAELIYSDEDKIDTAGVRFEPHFKSDWNPDLFYSINFISHLAIYRAARVKHLGGLRRGFEGSQDYDLALRVIEQIPETSIRHIPHVLYHWRAISGSVALGFNEKQYAHERARQALRAHLERGGKQARVEADFSIYHRFVYPVRTPAPLVSLIVGTRDRVELLCQTVVSVLAQTDYAPLELIIVNNQSREPETLAYLDEIKQDARVRVVDYDAPFNFSALNNLGVGQAQGEIVGLINNDIKLISSGWLREMVSHALRSEIGAVGAKLYYADSLIQHAGVVLGIGGVAGHAHKYQSRRDRGYMGRAQLLQNFSAVTGACLITRREVYREVGGFDETNLPIAFNDVDFCLRVRARGYRILWTPYAELYHLESASRGLDTTPEQRARFQRECAFMQLRWGDALSQDPYYNPNLTLKAENFALAFPPRAAQPWRELAADGASRDADVHSTR